MYVSIHPKRPGKFYCARLDHFRECNALGIYFENKPWRKYGIRIKMKDFIRYYDTQTGKYL